MADETDEIPSSTIEVKIQQIANQHQFKDLHDVLMVGSLEEARLKRSLGPLAERMEADLGRIEVEWVCRVRARAYTRPVELFPEEFPEGLDRDEEIERIRAVWLAGIERAEADANRPMLFSDLDSLVTQMVLDAKEPPAGVAEGSAEI